jgi:cytochrome c-type biogenesis protein CcsB
MKHLKLLFSPILMGILFVLFAAAMAVATFVENDFGSPVAYNMIYNTIWFELILFLLAVNLIGQMIIFKLYRKAKLPGFLFHLSFVVMIAGAAITRYAGWEGSIHIREGEEQNSCFSAEKYIGYSIKDKSGKVMDSSLEKYTMTSVSADNYGTSIIINNKKYELVLARIIPNAMEVPSGTDGMKATAVNPAEMQTGQNAFIFNLTSGAESQTIYLWDKESERVASASVAVDGTNIEITYGSMITTLPFSIRLKDFVLDRYPGSMSPSGYKSDVVLIDKAENVEKPFVIFMNNILKYEGYRFYQSSYDQDEKGTILSVSHDRAGMLVSYTGYALLFTFIVLSLLNKNSLFQTITSGHWQSGIRKGAALLLVLFVLSGLNLVSGQKFVPEKAVAEEFGKVLVQDQKGRTKPLFTLSNDILRKVTSGNDFEGLTSMQVYLGFYLDFVNWKDVPLIKVSSKDLQKQLGLRGNLVAFSQLVSLGDEGGTYKISELVNAAYSKAPAERNKMDKELMKVDERVNILYMVYRGDFLKLFPLKNGTHDWASPSDALTGALNKEDSTYLAGIVPVLTEALQTNNITTIRKIELSVSDYQKRFAGYELPSESRTSVELQYYKMNIFEKLFPFYGTIGLVMLIALIAMVIKGEKKRSFLVRITSWLLFAGGLFHTLGLGLRWYISGHSPMSNGYESLIFISWVTLLAGFIFSRKSPFALAATGVLASMTLMVAHLSFMDPEITNLVPVLQSYWLTLHVSVIISSYGFLGLGAILSLITMILLVLSNRENKARISNTIDELTVINYQSLTLGLYLLTIGTFLGAIWANESWGRYWGWDPKETWSLITIIIYSIVIHSRIIPGMKDIFTFSIISLFAFSSVLMTYFGVNYYLSGMHSYAAGDPVPVPTFVYVAVIVLTALVWVAYTKYNKLSKMPEPTGKGKKKGQA